MKVYIVASKNIQKVVNINNKIRPMSIRNPIFAQWYCIVTGAEKNSIIEPGQIDTINDRYERQLIIILQPVL